MAKININIKNTNGRIVSAKSDNRDNPFYKNPDFAKTVLEYFKENLDDSFVNNKK